MTTEDIHKSQRSFRARYLSGIKTSVLNNAVAYGYSVTITGAFEILNATEGLPSVLDVILFTLGAVGAFSVVELLVYVGFRSELAEEPVEVVVLGSAFSFLSIGLALGMSIVVGWLLNGVGGWLVGAFVATITYIGFLALEMSMAEYLRSRSSRDQG
jgi:hypothetical protein